jgi:hypothetical protein
MICSQIKRYRPESSSGIEYTADFERINAIKLQVLAYFIVD